MSSGITRSTSELPWLIRMGRRLRYFTACGCVLWLAYVALIEFDGAETWFGDNTAGVLGLTALILAFLVGIAPTADEFLHSITPTADN